MPPTNYTTTCSAVDLNGNTLVGARLDTGSFLHYSALVAKFDANGMKLWEFETGTTAYDGAESIAVDGAGNLFFTVRLPFEDGRPLFLIKLNASGRNFGG